MFAGATDFLGARSAASEAAFQSLFGQWHSRPNLSDDYWADPVARHRMYREAEVDEGLIASLPGPAVEILIDSGVVAGGVSDAGTAVAVIEFAGVTTTINARQPRLGAYRALDAFERELRAFIAEKLEGLEGPKWFKRRVPQDVKEHAANRRREALANGEHDASIIEFTDLGQLIPVVLKGDNWDQAFAQVFQNRAAFEVDMQRLVAARRPTMHGRAIDGVRLTETVCTIRRLIDRMEHWDDPAPDSAED
jgi:hypothetical protein